MGTPKKFLPMHIPAGETPTVRLARPVRGDSIFAATVAHSGEHKAFMNMYGAVSVMATNGHLLGLFPHEFEWVEGKPDRWGEGDKRIAFVITPYDGPWTLDAGRALSESLAGEPTP